MAQEQNNPKQNTQKRIKFNSSNSNAGIVRYTDKKLRQYKTDNFNNNPPSDNELYEDYIYVKKLNFYIGKNNSGKSRFLRALFNSHLLAWENNDNDKEIKFIGTNCVNYPYSRYREKPGKPLNSIYIPILRGLRPLIKNECAYSTRTEKDYFFTEKDCVKDNNKFEKGRRIDKCITDIIREGKSYKEEVCSVKEIYTGESLYTELVECLLGEPEQRELIKEYQNALAQYFFDGNEVTLIPKHGQDVVHIKIGDEAQRPIHDLGDGLQQVIILTYQAFIAKNKRHLFFIEEPELHMHAGMIRQLMNFYLNETKHYYFFTTHSNHLLDMVDESDEVMIQKFVKQSKADDSKESEFKIYRCGRDRDLLASLGVKPSSVYLANCTIWVEGITDRLYIIKYMQKYLDQLKEQEPDKYKKYLRFMPNYHYAFVEYSGGNIVHWSFSDDYADTLKDKGLSAKAVASDMLLIADGDNREKAERIRELTEELGEGNLCLLPCKEIENTLPFNAIVSVAKSRFGRMKAKTKKGFDISKLDELDQADDYFMSEEKGIGLLLDTQIRLSKTEAKKVFDDSIGENGAGTIKNKLPFCREVVKYFDEHEDWELTNSARELCEKIYEHIERCNA